MGDGDTRNTDNGIDNSNDDGENSSINTVMMLITAVRVVMLTNCRATDHLITSRCLQAPRLRCSGGAALLADPGAPLQAHPKPREEEENEEKEEEEEAKEKIPNDQGQHGIESMQLRIPGQTIRRLPRIWGNSPHQNKSRLGSNPGIP